jgi:hypothetical protein
MLDAIEDLRKLDSWPEVCARVGELIGLDGPAPQAVARRALTDERYAFYLMFTKGAPTLRARLLEDPRNTEYEPVGDSTLELAGRAAKAMARWTTAGLKSVDEETFQRRWGSCQACPLLVNAPDKIIYKGLAVLTGDRRVCSACGCVAVTKARVPTEHCPVADPGDPSRDRWGEPREPGTDHA